MARAVRPLELPRQARHIDRRRDQARRVDLVRLGVEHDRHAKPFTCRQVLLDRARVVGQVRALVELGRVDEDRDPDLVAQPLGLFDQAQVPGVQRAHRRHERNRRSDRPTMLTKFRDGLEEVQGGDFTGLSKLHLSQDKSDVQQAVRYKNSALLLPYDM